MIVELSRGHLFFTIDEACDHWPISFRGEFITSLSFHHIINKFLHSNNQDCPISQAPYALRRLITTNWENKAPIKMLDLMSYGALLRSLHKNAQVNGLAVGLVDHRTKQMKEYDQKNGLSFFPHDVKDPDFSRFLTRNTPFDLIICHPDSALSNFPSPPNQMVDMLRFFLNPGGILLTQYPGHIENVALYIEQTKKLGLCSWIGFQPQSVFFPSALMIRK